MAKKSAIQRNLERIKLVKRNLAKRKALKETIRTGSPEEQEAAKLQLQKMKRDSSPCRIRNRCRVCGRPCGTLRKFGLCRMHLRKFTMNGDVSGTRKSSW